MSMTIGPYMNGEELTTTRGGSREVVNPAIGKPVAEQLCCDEADVDRIVQATAAAYRGKEWQGLTAPQRGRLLLKLADLVEERADELIDLELQDVGKPVSQLRGGEIPLTADIIRFYAGAADKIEGAVKSTEGGHFYLTSYEPYGVVAGILPWNYPLVNAALKVPPALAAGCAIVLKPSAETPLSTLAFAKLCMEAGIPPGIVNVVTGSGAKAGNALVNHPSVDKISFTGSTEVGQAIQRQAVDTMKMVNLELGGKNAILVFEDADLERAAQAALLSAFVNNGQLCVSCSRLIVHENVHDAFIDLLTEKLARLQVGDPRDESTLVGPMITRNQYEIALKYLDIARAEGCTIACGGGKLDLPGDLQDGYWIEPTVITGVEPGHRVHDEEVFGPVLSVVRFSDEAEAVAISNSVQYGLSGSIWTRDGSRALRVSRKLDTGLIWINTMLAGYPQIPLAPHKMSGTGVELGMEGLLAYCKRKSLMIGYDEQAPIGWGL